MNPRTSRRKLTSAAVSIAAVAALALSACGGSSTGAPAGSNSPNVKLSLVAYSVPQAAYAKLIAAFQKTSAGKNIQFTQSYGASGDQSRAVAAGLKADVVNFALASDVTRLVKAGLVDASWTAGPTKGIVTDSVVVIGTRKGNPKGIKTWDDLTKPGVQVITPNPFTSGGARWNILAGYAAKSNGGQDDAAGMDYLSKLFSNVPVQDDSARKALQTFAGGKGDAVLDYEDDVLFAQKNGQSIDYTVPDPNILIENPIAVTKDSAHPAEAKAFVDFLLSPAAQKIWADNGFRPVVQVAGTNFPQPSKLYTIADLGGWDSATTKFFDPEKGALVSIEQKKGVAVKK
ncbi:MAG: sulfate ABC transporter substrate-binding protein [Actinomycetales bacterium]